MIFVVINKNLEGEIIVAKLSKKDMEELREFCSLGCEFSGTAELLERIVDLIEAMDLTVSIDIRDVKKKLTDLEKRSGYTLRTT